MDAPSPADLPAFASDRWTRRYGLVGAALLLAGFGVGLGVRWGDSNAGPPFVWDRMMDGRSPWWWTVQRAAPPVAAVLALVACARLRGARLAAALLLAGSIVAVGPLVADTATDAVRGSLFDRRFVETLFYFGWYRVAVLAAGIAIAAGNRVRRTYPCSTAARLLEGLGGIALPVALVMTETMPLPSGEWLPPDFGDLVSESTRTPAAIQLATIAILSVLGLLGLRAERRSTWRARALGRLTAVLPVLWFLAPSVHGVRGFGSAFGASFARSSAEGAMAIGSWMLASVGLAAWLVARVTAARTPVGAPAIDRSFG